MESGRDGDKSEEVWVSRICVGNSSGEGSRGSP